MLDSLAGPGARPAPASAPARAHTRPAAAHALHHPRTWGAEPLGGGRWRFALWSPEAQAVALDIEGRHVSMSRDADGFWRSEAMAQASAPYAFVVDGQATPDPLARAQAGTDPLGPSRLLDPRRHAWTTEWRGRPWEEAVLYELHIGTFTAEGTWDAAAERLPALAELGVTALEVMPVAHGPGMRGWGYDGALLAAPHPAYGSPEAMKRFVEAAQSHGIMVLLDVVLNHVAPEGSDLHRVCKAMFDEGEPGPWGARIDFSRPAVRAFMLDTVLGWLTEYRLDGLRFDAVHEMKDDSPVTIMEEIGEAVRSRHWGRPIHLVNEIEGGDSRLIRDGHSRAQWADDFHHAVHPLLTGEAWGYLKEFADDPVEKLRRTLGAGLAGTPEGAPEPPMGLPAYDLPWTSFVVHLQNHDQVGNRPGGDRLLSLVKEERAVEVAHALLLTSPFVPMMWMGEEEGETTPFHYFCHVSEELAEAIRKGRKETFGAMFESDDFPDPNDPATMEASRPFRDSGTHRARQWRERTAALLRLRHDRIVPLLKSGRAGPAVATRRGKASLSVTWPFQAGFVVAHVNLGEPPQEPPRMTDPHDVQIGDLASDPFAFALLVSRP